MLFILTGMIGNNPPRPTMPSGDWGTQGAAVRVTCAATTSAMNRPIQGGMIRNPTSNLPLRPSGQPGPRQMLQSQVMNMGKLNPNHSTFCFELVLYRYNDSPEAISCQIFAVKRTLRMQKTESVQGIYYFINL